MPTIKRQPRVSEPKQAPGATRVMPLADLPDAGIKLCVYGKSGSGKTRFMSTFATQGDLLHIICSSNGINEARSIRGTPNVYCVELQKSEELIELATSGNYKTICLDHVTAFCDLILAELLGVTSLPEQGSWGLAKREQYQQMGLQAKTYLRELMKLPCNIILTGQERAFDTMEEGGEALMPYVSVAATPSVSGWIAPAVDYMCQTFKREGYKTVTRKMGEREVTNRAATGKKEFCLRVGPDPTYITKFRVPPAIDLPDVVVDPTYEKISHLIN